MTKIQAMKALEKAGLSFTANVIMCGCGKPTTKMRTLVKLIATGHDVRQAQFDCYAVVVDGKEIPLSSLDYGTEAVLNVVSVLKGE